MSEIRFRVYWEAVLGGKLHKGIESSASWFLLTQTGALMQHGPMSPLKGTE